MEIHIETYSSRVSLGREMYIISTLTTWNAAALQIADIDQICIAVFSNVAAMHLQLLVHPTGVLILCLNSTVFLAGIRKCGPPSSPFRCDDIHLMLRDFYTHFTKSQPNSCCNDQLLTYIGMDVLECPASILWQKCGNFAKSSA